MNERSVRGGIGSYSSEYADEMNLLDSIMELYKKKFIIAFVVGLAGVGSVWYSLTLPNIYTAETLLVPAGSDGSAGGLGSLAAKYGNVARLAGIELPGGGGMKNEALAVLKSRKFITDFIQERGLLTLLFEELWDPEKETWIRKEKSWLESQIDEYKHRFISQGKKKNSSYAPSLNDAYEVFTGGLTVSEEIESGLVTVSLEWTDPELAALWTNELIMAVNVYMRDQAKSEFEKAIKFLEKQIENTSLVEAREVLFNVVEEQTKATMLASVREQYAFRVIDPAIAPDTKSKPSRFRIVILTVIVAFAVCVIWILLLASARGASVPVRETKGEETLIEN